MKPRRSLFLGSFLVIAFGATSSAFADTYNWIGGAGNWDTVTANWTGFSTTWPAVSTLDDDAIFGGTAGIVTIAAGGITANSLTFNTTGYSINGGTLTLDGTTPSITNATGIDAAISSVIAGSSGLTKAGDGILTLSGVNTYTGGTTINAGTILATLSTTQNSISTGAVSIASGSTLQLNNTNTSNTNVTVSNAFTGAGTLRLNFAAGTTARNTALNGVTGFTGTIRLSNSGSTGDKWIISSLGTVNAAVQIDSGNTLYTAAGTSTFTGGITVSDGGNSENRGAIRLEANSTLGGNVTLAGSTNIGGGNSTTSIISGNILSGAAGTQTLTLGGASGNGDFTISGNIGGGTGTIAVTKSTSGTVVLSGINTYTGSTTLSGGGVLSVNTIGNQSEDSSVGAGTTISIGGGSSAGTLLYTGTAKTTNRIIAMSGGTAGSNVTIDQSGTGLLKFTSNFSNVSAGITKTLTLQGSTAGTGEISGSIQEGSGGMVTGLNKAGSGTWTLSGNNTYTGVTTITAGVLNVANLTNYGVSGALGNRASGTEATSNIGTRFMGGTLQYTGSTAQNTNRQIRLGANATNTIDASGTGTGTVNFAYTAANTDLFDTAGARTLTLTGSNTGNNIFAIRLTDQSASTGKTSLVKSGVGTWNLTGISSYSGSTNITGGVLSVGSTGVINVGASTTVGTSTITGGGRLLVDGGAATFRGNAANTVVLGDSSNPGHITVQNNGSLTINNGQLIMGQGNGSTTNNTLAAATLTQTGGTITVNSTTTGYVGNYTPSTLNISGGAFSHTNHNFVLGTRADASLTLSGTGTANFANLQLGNSSTTNLVDVHLNTGGTLAVNSITQGGSNGVNTFNFDGGTLKARADSTTFFTGGDNAYIKNGGGTIDTQAFNITIGQALKRFTGATTDTLTKIGGGALTLSGASTYGGGTNIQNGSIIIGVANDRLLNTSTVTLGSAGSTGKFVLGDGTARNQTLAGLTVTGLGGSVVGGAGTNSTLTISTTGSVDFGGVLGGGNANENTLALAKSGTGTFTLSGASANTYTGLTTITAGTLSLGKTAGINAIAGNINMGSGSTTNLVLAANNQISDSSVITFAPTSGIYSYFNLTGHAETLGGISDSTGRGVIQNEQTGSGKAATVLTINNSIDYSFNGYFRNVSSGTTGTLGLTKEGVGKQTLSGTLINYTGPTTINAGTLELSGATAFASSVGFGVGSTGILQMAGATGTIRGLGTADATNNNVFVQNAAGTDNVLTINQADNTSFGGVIRDNATSNKLAITKSGAGTLTLTNSNTFTGDVTVTAGLLSISNSNALGSGTKKLYLQGASRRLELTNGITLGSNITLNLQTNTNNGVISSSGANEIQGAISLTSGGTSIGSDGTSTLTLSGNITANGGNGLVLYGTSTNANTVSGIIADGTTTTTLAKNLGGTWILSNANTFKGNTTVTAGTLKLAHNLAIQNSAFDPSGAGTLDATSINTPTFGGLTSATNYLLPGNVTSLTLNPGTGVTQTYTGNLSGGAAGLALTKSGAGTQILGGTNTYSGLTTVNGGELRVTNAGAIGGNYVTVTSGQIALDGGITIANTKSLTTSGNGNNFLGGLQSVSGSNEWSGSVLIGADLSRIGARKNASLVVSGAINDGASSFGLVVRNEGFGTNTNGAGNTNTITVLSGANTYGGNTQLINGLTKLDGGDNRLPVGTILQFGLATTNAKFDMNGRNQEVAGLAVASSGTDNNRDWNANELTNSSGTLSALTVNTAADQVFGGTLTNNIGVITGKIALVKSGSMKLMLSGANTYTGDTTVTQGTLEIATGGSLAADSSVTVENLAILSVAGTVNGLLTVDDGGTLTGNGGIFNSSVTIDGIHSPGASPGLQTFTNGLSYGSTATLNAEFVGDALGLRGTDFDGIDVTGGDLSIDSLATLNLLTSGIDYTLAAWDISRDFTVINHSGAGNSTGLFVLNTSAAGSFASEGSWSLANTSNDIVLSWTPVPEPRAAILGLLGTLALLRRRR